MNKKTFIAFLLYIPFLFFPYWVNNYNEVSYLNYAFFLFFYLVLYVVSKEGIKFLLSPSSITCLYLYVCFILGDLLFRNEVNIMAHHTDHYLQWHHYELSSTYTNICIYLSLISYFLINKGEAIKKHATAPITKPSFIFLSFVFIVAAPFASLDIPGGLNKMILSLTGIGLICYFANKKNIIRYIVYLVILAIMAVANPDDKRNSIFLIYVILLVESRNLSKLSFSKIIVGVVAAFSVFLLIVIMSIFRTGMVDSLSEVFSYMPIYLTSDLAIGALANNFEVDYVFINSFTPIEFIEDNHNLLNYGMSYLKVLFIPFSRDLMPFKPEATMVLYTKVYDSASAAASGLCYPINMAAEAYWNFRYFGIFITPVIYYFLNLYYCRGVRMYLNTSSIDNFSAIFYLYVMYLITFLIRGSGFDIFISSMIMVWCLNKLFQLSSITKYYKRKR